MPTWEELWSDAAIDEACIDDLEQLAAVLCYAARFGDDFYRQVIELQIDSINAGLAAP